MKHVTIFILSFLITSHSYGTEQIMDTSKVLGILQSLCQSESQGWIQQGRIEATHLSTDTVSGETERTHESIKTDGDRFIWRIQIPEDKERLSAKQRKKDRLAWNQDRTFVWDGHAYTLYFNPGNHAIVYENPSIPVVVTGPLKAGYIPWGQGIFTYKSLSAGYLSGTRIYAEDGPRIRLSIEPTDDDMQMEFILDPDKDNAVLNYTQFRSGSKTVQTYGNFIEHAGRWIPTNILIDRYEGNRLRSSDVWEITLLHDGSPAQASFAPALRQDALVEHHSPVLERPIFYRHTKKREIQPLLDKRFMAALKKNVQKQNCATVAAEKILSAFGVSVEDSELESMVNDRSNKTSLYRIQKLMQEKGLICLSVKTDIAGLQQFEDSQVLLHFSRKKHFVVLDRVEKKKVWIIDLDRQTFYHSMDRDRFLQEWVGIALVVSDKPLLPGKKDIPLPDKVLQNIVGSADYSCQFIQGVVHEHCPKMWSMGICGGRYTQWNPYYACQPGSEGEFCLGTEVVGGFYSPCIEVGNGQCSTNGVWSAQPIRMCQP